MKKIITALTALTLLFGTTANVSADTIFIDNPEEFFPPEYVRFNNYGFSGYYNTLYFDSNNFYYNEEFEWYERDIAVAFQIREEDGVYYMYSRRIEGEDADYVQPGWKKAPLADVLASIPRYEYKMSDMATVQRFFRNEDIEINLKDAPYLDYNADKIVNSVDLSLIKYELLH
ncbi:MAG: hypothetical protein LBL93_02535 [Ruminococcus sp.]|jgi:ABC-type transport system substrate-binding protein|nr:hypothetical protein [Ruminococcus sp.]